MTDHLLDKACDLYCHGIARIDTLGPSRRLVFTIRSLESRFPDIVVVKYWMPFMGPCLGTILRIVKKNRHTKVVCIADNIIPHEKRFGDVSF